MFLFSLHTHKHFHFGYSSEKQPRPSMSFLRYSSTPAKLRSIGLPFEREQHNIARKAFEDRIHYERQCMQKVCEVAGSLGRDGDDVECGVLSRDAVSRNLFETLLPKMRSLQAQGGTGGSICNAWMLTLGVLLTSK